MEKEKNTIIGTAGHVDHGKTSLIKALTGNLTDRLKEEQKRGITIELGFADLIMPDGHKIGIIDVPGHEKFIKNMLAGAGGIDIALLVIAADEGIMPQTREHIEILSLLGIKEGIIALTKTDMVDEDWCELVILDIEEELAQTFLKGAKIMKVSAFSGEGVEELRELLFERVENLDTKNTEAAFRVPIDRVFSVDGFGTVITGTLTEGKISVGDEIMIYPSEIMTKARSVQVHGQDVETAFAGQRTAINLAGISKEDVEKGDTLAKAGTMENSFMLDVRLDVLASSQRTVKNGSRVHLYHGSSEYMARVILLGEDEVSPGKSAYAQLRLDEKISTKTGDRFVIRFFSPLETIGGGVILDSRPKKHGRHDKDVLQRLTIKEKGSLKEKIEIYVFEKSSAYPTKADVLGSFSADEQAKAEFESLAEEKIILLGNCVVHKDFLKSKGKEALRVLNLYHEENPLRTGMRREEFKTKIRTPESSDVADELLKKLVEMGYIGAKEDLIFASSFAPVMTDLQEEIKKEILQIYKEAGFSPEIYADVEKNFIKNKNEFKSVFASLISSGELIRLNAELSLHSEVFESALKKLKSFIEANEKITLAEFRDELGTSRKYAVAMLEYMDAQKITKKVDDYRVLYQ